MSYVQDENGKLYRIMDERAFPVPPIPPVPNPSTNGKENSRFWLAAGLIVSAMILGLAPAVNPALNAQSWLTAIIATGASNAVSFYFGSKKL